MRIVWSLWTLPIFNGLGTRWLEVKYWLYSWILSFECVRKHYSETVLVTDDDGAFLLVDGLGLDFSEVNTDLNSLKYYNPKLWAMGKLHAYRLQDVPFLHLDSDVFLWEPLPNQFIEAPVFAQSPEPFQEWDEQWYSPQVFEAFLYNNGRGWLPKEWHWYRNNQKISQEGACCGVFGGTDLSFINYYANLAFQIIDNKENRSGLLMMPNMQKNIVLIEQYLLSAISNYYVYNPCPEFQCSPIKYLFDDPTFLLYAEDLEYTHLIGPAKKSLDICLRLEKRIQEYFPDRYEKCIKLMETQKELICMMNERRIIS
jgi:hypothetical protein